MEMRVSIYCARVVLAALLAFSGAFWLGAQERQRPEPGQGPRGPGMRPHRMGAVELPSPEVRIYTEGKYRYIESNGVPDHEHGEFPTRGNPNAIRPQEHKLRTLRDPVASDEPIPAHGGIFGIAINGIPFEPGTAERYENNPRSNWHYEALTGHLNLGIDDNNAHVQPSGTYHYHGLPTGLIHKHGGENEITLLGYAADGFPVYSNIGFKNASDPKSGLKEMRPSYSLKKGTRPEGEDGPGGEYDGRFTQDWEYVEGSGDLDEFNGRYGVTPEYPDGIYHYYVTDTFPYISRMFKGKPDESFLRRRGGPGGPRGARGPGDRRGPPRGGPPPGRG